MNAGIGCASGHGRRRMRHHRLVERLPHVGDVEGDAQRVCDAARVEGIVEAAAVPGLRARARCVVQLHMHPDHIVALLDEQGGDNGGIDSSTHGDDDTGQRVHRVRGGPE